MTNARGREIHIALENWQRAGDATVGTETWRFYGVQPAHDHDASTTFSIAVTGVMKATYGADAAIELGHFASNQPSIPIAGAGFKGVVELVYKNKAWSQK